MTSEDESDRKRSTSPSGRDNKRRRGFISSEGHNVNGKELFVSNLPFDLTWQQFKDTVKDLVGEVPYVKLYNNEQGKPRGCGTMGFKNQESIKIALEKMQGYEIKGRKIKVNEAFDEPRDEYGYLISSKGLRKKDGERRGFDVRDRGSSSRLLSRSGPHESSITGEEYGLKPQFLASLGISGSLTNRIWVSNLDEERVDERKLMEVFRLAGRVGMVQLSRTREGKSKGHAIIEYNHPLEAVQAISMMNNSFIHGKKIFVRPDRVGDKSGNQFSNRFPDGLTTVGMGLGPGGAPLPNISERSLNPDSGLGATSASRREENNELAEELKLVRNDFMLLKDQLKAIGGMEGYLKLTKMSAMASLQSTMSLSAKNNNKDEEELIQNKPKTSGQQMLDLIDSATRRFQSQTPSSRDYEHRSATSIDQRLPTDLLSYGSKWF